MSEKTCKTPEEINVLNVTKIKMAIDLITEYGMTDGSHHKQWVLDQVARTLLGARDYSLWSMHGWDAGCAP
jgi:hypothetical protein